MRLSHLILIPAIMVFVGCSSAKERYFDCIEKSQEYVNELKEEIRRESGRRKAPHPSETIEMRYGGFGRFCETEYREYQKESQIY